MYREEKENIRKHYNAPDFQNGRYSAYVIHIKKCQVFFKVISLLIGLLEM